MERSEEELDAVLNEAYEIKNTIGTRWRGMSYEDGVIAAIEWMRGDRDESPMAD
jgi:hypothetical protein